MREEILQCQIDTIASCKRTVHMRKNLRRTGCSKTYRPSEITFVPPKFVKSPSLTIIYNSKSVGISNIFAEEKNRDFEESVVKTSANFGIYCTAHFFFSRRITGMHSAA